MTELTCYADPQTARLLDKREVEVSDSMGRKVIQWVNDNYWLYPYRENKHADPVYIVGDGLTKLSAQQYGLVFLTEFKIKAKGL